MADRVESRGGWKAVTLWAAACGILSGCTSEHGGGIEQSPTTSEAANIHAAEPSTVTLQHVADTFALGSKATDLQRTTLKKELIGSVVEWDILVFEVSESEGTYIVTSQPVAAQSVDSISLTTVIAFVQAQSDDARHLVHSLRTDDVVRIRGRVEDLLVRSAVILRPAIVMSAPEINAQTG